MQNELTPVFHTFDQPVSVGIPTREQELKEKHHRGPDGGRPTKPRQDKLADHRLNLKEEKRGEKDAGGEEEHGCSQAN